MGQGTDKHVGNTQRDTFWIWQALVIQIQRKLGVVWWQTQSTSLRLKQIVLNVFVCVCLVVCVFACAPTQSNADASRQQQSAAPSAWERKAQVQSFSVFLD